MDTPLTPEQAKERLKSIASQQRHVNNTITVAEAKTQLKTLDEQLELPALASYLDQGDFKTASLLITAWAFSQTGRNALTPRLTTLVNFIFPLR